MNNSILIQYYVQQYLNQVNRYMYEYRGSVVTYYRLNQQQSIMDKTLLMGGTYERVGQLSGLRFDQIINFYVAGSEQIVPLLNAEEKGVLVDYRTTIMFPKIDFEPTMYDFLVFTIANEVVGPVFQVVNFSLSYMQNAVPIYKADIKGVGIPLNLLQKQAVNIYGYTDIDHAIHPINEYNMIINSYQIVSNLESNIIRDPISGFILTEMEQLLLHLNSGVIIIRMESLPLHLNDGVIIWPQPIA